jgi:hypothetical protein
VDGGLGPGGVRGNADQPVPGDLLAPLGEDPVPLSADHPDEADTELARLAPGDTDGEVGADRTDLTVCVDDGQRPAVSHDGRSAASRSGKKRASKQNFATPWDALPRSSPAR